MGRVVTARPSSVHSAQSVNSPFGDLAAVLRDDNDGTWDQFITPGAAILRTRLNTQTLLQLAATERTQAFKLRSRWRSSGVGGTDTYFALADENTNWYWSTYQPGHVEGIQTIDYGWQNWYNATQHQVDTLLAVVQDNNGGQTLPLLYELYVDVQTNYAPNAPTGLAPSGALATHTGLVASWTHSDPEADPQSYYQVKLFNIGQYSAVGFNPTTSPSFFDTGVVASAATSVALPNPLVGDAYRMYVRTGDYLGVGAWAFVDFVAPARTHQMMT